MSKSLYDAGFRPFNPVYPVERAPSQTIPLLMQGLDRWAQYDQLKEAKALAAQKAAEEVVDYQEAARIARDLIGDPRGLANAAQDYDSGAMVADAISGAGAMARTAGSNMRPMPIQIQPTAPLGAAAVAPYTVDVGAPAALPTGLASQAQFRAPAPVPAPRPAARVAPRKVTQGTSRAALEMARTLGQIRVANDAATGRMDVTRERNRYEALKLRGQTGVQILKLRQQALDTMSKERIAVKELAARAADRANDKPDKDLERLRDYAAQAQREFSAAREQTSKLASIFAADAEPDTGLRQTYDRFDQQAREAEAIYIERKNAYEKAMAARGLTPRPIKPLNELSDEELDAAFRAVGGVP